MGTLAFDLPLIWAAIIVLGVIMYVLLDGFDLGVGILFPFAREHRHRDVMMNSLAPFWDGNETWLVLGGGGLFAAFPLAYAIIMPALYLPLIVMLLALVFRGVAFEFRFKAARSRGIWDWSFALGSTVAAFSSCGTGRVKMCWRCSSMSRRPFAASTIFRYSSSERTSSWRGSSSVSSSLRSSICTLMRISVAASTKKSPASSICISSIAFR